MPTPLVIRRQPDPGDTPLDPGERVRLLVVEPTPLVALAWAGRLDALLSGTGELLISDLAEHDAGATPEVATWLAANGGRYGVVATATMREHAKAMTVWERLGRPEDTEPRRLKADLIEVVSSYEAAGEDCIVLADDMRSRAVVRTFNPAARVIGSATVLMWRM